MRIVITMPLAVAVMRAYNVYVGKLNLLVWNILLRTIDFLKREIIVFLHTGITVGT